MGHKLFVVPAVEVVDPVEGPVVTDPYADSDEKVAPFTLLPASADVGRIMSDPLAACMNDAPPLPRTPRQHPHHSRRQH